MARLNSKLFNSMKSAIKTLHVGEFLENDPGRCCLIHSMRPLLTWEAHLLRSDE